MKPVAVTRSSSPQVLRPEIARIIEELARAAVRREDRRAREAAINHEQASGDER